MNAVFQCPHCQNNFDGDVPAQAQIIFYSIKHHSFFINHFRLGRSSDKRAPQHKTIERISPPQKVVMLRPELDDPRQIHSPHPLSMRF